MITFLCVAIIIVVVVCMVSYKLEESEYNVNVNAIVAFGVIIGIFAGIGATFLGGSFVKKEIVVEKYFILPMVVDGKSVVAIEEGNLSTFILYCQ